MTFDKKLGRLGKTCEDYLSNGGRTSFTLTILVKVGSRSVISSLCSSKVGKCLTSNKTDFENINSGINFDCK